jgi:hypothetical protein
MNILTARKGKARTLIRFNQRRTFLEKISRYDYPFFRKSRCIN